MPVTFTKQSPKIKLVKINGYSLLNIRLWCYSLAFIHLSVTAVVTLTLDLTGDEDPAVRAYNHIRWKLITFWFNAVSLIYLPLCLYCDWREKRAEESRHVETLRVLLDVVMTAGLAPITILSDIAFWTMFKMRPALIGPPRVFEYLPYWTQHSLHTISMVTIMMDLILTPRSRPKTMKPRLTVLVGLVTAYGLMLYLELLNGESVYAFLTDADNTMLLTTYFSTLAMLIFLYYAQWQLIGYIWVGIQLGHKNIKLTNKIHIN